MGTVNIADLALVAGALGTTGQNAADVNDDGTVDLADLVLVAGALGTSTAAPSLNTQFLSTLTTADVKQWLSEAQQLEFSRIQDVSTRYFVLTTTPGCIDTEKRQPLLANYPNPFNSRNMDTLSLGKGCGCYTTYLCCEWYTGADVDHLDIKHQGYIRTAPVQHIGMVITHSVRIRGKWPCIFIHSPQVISVLHGRC